MTTETKLHPFRAWRLLKGKTLEECAACLGVTFQHLGHVERNERNPSMELVLRMADMAADDLGATRDHIAAFHGNYEGGAAIFAL